jgi:hypothetical protein
MMTMRRTARVALFLVLVMAVTVSPVVTRAAQSRIPSNVAADFDGDGVPDLAVGVPGENAAAGAVNVLYGTGGGLSGTGSQLFDQVGSAVEQLDTFGSALAAGDFNQDGFPDLAAAAPQEDIGGDLNAGTVSVLHGSAAGLTASGGRLFTQVGGRVEVEDQFGAQTASGGRLFTQASPGVVGAAEPNDKFGGWQWVP